MSADREWALRAADAIGLHEDSCHSAWSPDLECDCDALRTRHLVADALLAAEQRGRQYSCPDHDSGPWNCPGCVAVTAREIGRAEGERRVREALGVRVEASLVTFPGFVMARTSAKAYPKMWWALTGEGVPPEGE